MNAYTHNFRVSLAQYWEIFRAEYHRLEPLLGYPPFSLLTGADIDAYVPNDAEELTVVFYARENPRQEVLVIDAILLPDEDRPTVQVIVHFEEPVQSAMQIWVKIKKTREKAQKRRLAKKDGNRRHRRYGSLKKLLEKIASRDESIANYDVAPAWSLVAAGELSERTANEINDEMGGVIRKKWEVVSFSGDDLANLVIAAYSYHPNLKTEWKRLKSQKTLMG